MKKILNGGLILGLLALGSLCLKADNTIYIDDSSNNIGVVDLTTDTVTVLGNAKVALHDIAITANGNFYGVTQTALYSLSLTNGASSLISTFPSSIGAGNMDSLVGYGNQLLAASGNNSTIYALDVSPYSATALSGKANGTAYGDITFGPAGATGPLYESLSNGNLDKVTISGTTITSVVIGNMGKDFNGMATVGGVTYGITGTEIYAIDLANATVVPVFNYAGHGLGNDSGAAAFSMLTVPEPSNIALLLAGLSVLFLYQSRKRAQA